MYYIIIFHHVPHKKQYKYEKYTATKCSNEVFLFRIPCLYSFISLNFLHLFHLVSHSHANVSVL